MMKIAIVYATYSGTTKMMVDHLENYFSDSGHNIDIYELNDNLELDNIYYDVVFFSTPSWFDEGKDGQPHTSFLSYISKHSSKKFTNLKAGFIGLGDNTFAHFCKGIDIVEDFFVKNGALKIGETLRLDKYQFHTKKGRADLINWINSLPL